MDWRDLPDSQTSILEDVELRVRCGLHPWERHPERPNRLLVSVELYTTTAFDQEVPAVAMDADGDFVVAWESYDNSVRGVYARRYSASGAAQGQEFRVNTFTTSNQDFPSVGMDADGDFVVIRQQDTARDGDIVVAQVEENAVTLKRFFREKDRVRLQPANPNYPPQFYPSVRIQGKLIGVIRRLD